MIPPLTKWQMDEWRRLCNRAAAGEIDGTSAMLDAPRVLQLLDLNADLLDALRHLERIVTAAMTADLANGAPAAYLRGKMPELLQARAAIARATGT